jgi:hypothetical protein
MDRKNYYHGQIVTEDELDAGFADVEALELNLAIDHGLCQGTAGGSPDVDVYGGIVSGLVVTRVDATTVQVTAGVARDGSGRRIELTSTATVKVTNQGDTEEGDTTNATGDYPTPIAISVGKEAWLSLFIVYDENLSEPRQDGGGSTVFFEEDESFHFNLTQGTEGTVPCTTNRAALATNKVLLTDILLDANEEIAYTAPNYGICGTSEEFDDYDPSNYASMEGRRADWIALDNATDFPQFDDVDIEIRAGNARAAIYDLVKKLQAEAAPAGARTVGARAQTGSGTRTAYSLLDLAAGSIDEQLLFLLEAVNNRFARGGDSIIPVAGANGLALDPTNLDTNRALLALKAMLGGASTQILAIDKRGLIYPPGILIDDFLYAPTGASYAWDPATNAIWGFYDSASGATCTLENAIHGGIVKLTTGGAATNFCELISGYGVSSQNIGYWNPTVYDVAAAVTLKLTALAETEVQFGFRQTGAGATVNHAYVIYDGPTDEFKCRVYDSASGTDLSADAGSLSPGALTTVRLAQTAADTFEVQVGSGGTPQAATVPGSFGSGPYEFYMRVTYKAGGVGGAKTLHVDRAVIVDSNQRF